jgi:hypothetical protein
MIGQFRAIHANRLGRDNSQADAASLSLEDFDADAAFNHDAFTSASSKNQHGRTSVSKMRCNRCCAMTVTYCRTWKQTISVEPKTGSLSGRVLKGYTLPRRWAQNRGVLNGAFRTVILTRPTGGIEPTEIALPTRIVVEFGFRNHR